AWLVSTWSACAHSKRRSPGSKTSPRPGVWESENVTEPGTNRKLVVFVPAEALDAVRDAVFAVGAGRIGDYERCSWYTEGTGTFFAGEGAAPTVGERGREERVPELR